MILGIVIWKIFQKLKNDLPDLQLIYKKWKLKFSLSQIWTLPNQFQCTKGIFISCEAPLALCKVIPCTIMKLCLKCLVALCNNTICPIINRLLSPGFCRFTITRSFDPYTKRLMLSQNLNLMWFSYQSPPLRHIWHFHL